MKSLLKKILVLTIVCMLVLSCMTACSSRGKKVMELDGSDITVNMLMLLMSRMKGNLASGYGFGTQALNDSFWNTVKDASTGETFNDYYTNMVIDNAKTYLAALYLFEELDLKLPQSTIDEIDEEMQRLVDTDGQGSKNYLNTILAEFGANYTVLREAYIMEAKIAYLSDHLFGTNGSLISQDNYERYYQENYVRFKHIFFFTTEVVYQTDSNGDEIYYSDLSNRKIAYADDSKRDGAYKKHKDGKVATDSNGDNIWLYKDEEGNEHISYDKKGTEEQPSQRNPILDENGNVLTRKLSEDELIALSDKVQLIMEDKAREGEYALFDTLVATYGEDEGMDKYANGYYLTRTSDYDSPEVLAALFEMEEGEIRRVESEYGIHIVMKYELDEGGYANKANESFFISSDGTYSFLADLKSDMLDVYLQKYKESIVVDEKLLKTVDMKSVGANYYY